MWTEELLALMFTARRRNMEKVSKHKDSPVSLKMVTEQELFNEMGFQPEKVYLAN